MKTTSSKLDPEYENPKDEVFGIPPKE